MRSLPAADAAEPAPIASTMPVYSIYSPSIIFVDPSVQDISVLTFGARLNAELVFLLSGLEGLSQIVRHLNRRGKQGCVHILGDVALGRLSLAGKSLTLRDLRERADDLARIGQAIKPSGEVVIGAGSGQDGQGDQFCRTFGDFAGVAVRLWPGLGGRGI